MSIHDMFPFENNKTDFELDKLEKLSHPTILTLIVGAQKNHLTEAILLRNLSNNLLSSKLGELSHLPIFIPPVRSI